MKYNEVVTVIETVANALPVSFYHYTEDHVNEYQGDFPVAVMFPPSASISYNESNGVASTASYDIRIAFMDLISPESDRSEKQTVVNTQHDNAASMVITLIQGEDLVPEVLGSTVRNIRIDPFFTFPWNSHLTSGVVLYFTWDTTPTWDCAQVPATTLPDPIARYFGDPSYEFRPEFSVGTSYLATLSAAGLIPPFPQFTYEYRTHVSWKELGTIDYTQQLSVLSLDPGTYWFRCKYELSDGRVSQWSAETQVVLT